MKRFDHRARVSASLYNRTLETIGKLQTFKSSAWGSSYGSGLACHFAVMGLGYLTSHVVDDPVAGWMIPRGTKPVWTGGSYGIIQAAFSDASVIRTDNPYTPDVTGQQLMLNGSSLRDPAVVFDPGAGAIFSDRLKTAPYDEDPDAVPITETPVDNWTYPGGYDSQGRPWAVNPSRVTRDTPYWQYMDQPDCAYDWWPAVTPIGATGNGVHGGLYVGGGWEGYVHMTVTPIGLPMELQVGPECRIESAKCELSFSGAAVEHRVFEAASKEEEVEVLLSGGVLTTDNVPLALVLLAGKTRYYGEESAPLTHWEPVGNWPAGTFTAGKTVVVDVTGPLQTMMDLSASDYDSFAIAPSVGVEFLGTSNAAGLKGIMGDEPELAWDEDAQAWYISNTTFRSISWDSYSLSGPVVNAIWPDSVIGRHVLPLQWPPMD